MDKYHKEINQKNKRKILENNLIICSIYKVTCKNRFYK